jgi:hypothetical protein
MPKQMKKLTDKDLNSNDVYFQVRQIKWKCVMDRRHINVFEKLTNEMWYNVIYNIYEKTQN